MTTIPVKVNSALQRPKDVGRTLVFDFSVTSATVFARSVLVRQSTSALVPHSDPFNDISQLVTKVDFWLLPEFNPKHFVMVQAPYDFTLKFNDHTLSNNLELDIKRMFCFAGKFEGRLTIESEIEQTIRLTYA